MSYVVHVTAVVEGDLDQIEILMNDYRCKCLEKQIGMEQFFVCRSVEQKMFFSTRRYLQIRQHTRCISKGRILSGSLNRCPKINSNFKDNGLQELKLTPLQDMSLTNK